MPIPAAFPRCPRRTRITGHVKFSKVYAEISKKSNRKLRPVRRRGDKTCTEAKRRPRPRNTGITGHFNPAVVGRR